MAAVSNYEPLEKFAEGSQAAVYLRKHASANLAIVLSCLALIGITWAWTLDRATFERAETVANAIKQNENLALAFEEHTIRTLRGVDQAISFVKSQYLEHGLKLNLRKMIENGTVDAGLFVLIGITDERGNLVLGSVELELVNVAERESFKVHRGNNADGMLIGKPILGRATRKWVVPMSHRIDKADGSFGGMVFVSVDPEYFTGFYQKADLGQQGAVSLVGLDGIARATRIGRKGTVGEDMRATRTFSQQAKNRIGSFLGGGRLDGVVRFLSFRTLAQYPLIVTVGTSEAEVMASFRERERSYYMNAGFASAMVVFFAAFMMAASSRRKLAVEALRDNETQLREAQRVAKLGSWEWHVNTDTNIWSQEHYRIFGRDPKLPAPTYKQHPQLYAPESWERLKAVVEETLRTARPYELDLEFLRADGTRGWLVARGEALRDATGKITRLRGTAQDITERKRAEQAALDQFKLAETIFNHSVSCFVVLDRNFNFLRVNEAYARACRREIGEFAGRNHFEMFPSDGKAIFEDVVRTGKPFETFAMAFVFPDQPERGVTYWDWTLVPVLDEQGEVECLVFSLNDVTERKRAQQVLEQSMRQVQALSERMMKVQQEERDDIARELHDELGQTLTALKVNLQMLEPYCADGEAEDHLTEALMITGRALEQVHSITFDLRPAELEFLGLAAVLEAHAARQAQAAGWRLHFEAAAALGRLSPELETACFRVAQESLTNVMRHAGAKQVWVSLGLNGAAVELSVRDDGKGFDADKASDGLSSPSLGLIGMRERVRLRDGRLTIRSAIGRGTEVRASFPIEPAGGREPDANAQTQA